MKGIPHSITVIDKIIEIWVESPTGDSSDTQILKITCKDNQQASFIATTWENAWDIDNNAIRPYDPDNVEQNESDWMQV